MHRVLLNASAATSPLQCGPGSFVMQDSNTGEALAYGLADEAHHLPLPTPTWNTPLPGVLFVRAGGFGDMLMFTGILSEIHAAHPETKLGVACFPIYAPLLEHLPFPVEIVPYPIAEADWQRFPVHVSLEHVIEREPGKHAMQAMAEACGRTTFISPLYQVTADEATWAADRWPRADGEKRLGIQVHASAAARSYPAPMLAQVIRDAGRDGWQVFLFGDPGIITPGKDQPAYIVNLTAEGLSFRQSAAVAATCDVLLTPDSALVHLAGALKIPCVALYGPFHWHQRTKHYPTVHALQGWARCAPCHHHVRGGQQWPAHGPCNETGYCQAMASLKPDRVLRTLNGLHALKLPLPKPPPSS